MSKTRALLRGGLLPLALIVTTALLGCGERGGKPTAGPAGGSAAAPKAAAVAEGLQALVPSNAALMVYIKSPEDLQRKVRGLVGRIDAEAATEIDLGNMLAGMAPGAGEHWDPQKPMAIAVPLPAQGQPIEAAMNGISLILGMKDANAAKAAMQKAFEARMADIPEKYRPPAEKRPRYLVSGDYLAMAQGPEIERGGAAIAATAPDGDLGLRIDLAALVARFRTEIDQGLADMDKAASGALEELPPSARSLGGLFEQLGPKLRQFVDSAETLDVALSVDGGEAEIAVGFVARQGSALDRASPAAGDLAAMAKLLPEGKPLHLLFSADLGKLMEQLMPLMEAGLESMPEAQRAGLAKLLKSQMELAKLTGPNAAMTLSFGDGGFEVIQVVDCKDGATYLARLEEIMTGDALAAMPGISTAKSGTSSVAGVDVHSYALSFDIQEIVAAQGGGRELPPEALAKMKEALQAVFGGESMRMHAAAVEGKLLFIVGAPAAMAGVIDAVRKGGGQAPAALAQGLARARGKPTFMLQMDLRGLVGQILGVARKIAGDEVPQLPDGDPIPVLVWGMHDGRVYGGGLRLDVGGIMDVVKQMDK